MIEEPLNAELAAEACSVNPYVELGSHRAVAALVGCDHKTVKAWLEREQRGEDRRPRPRTTDAYLPLIRQKVEKTQGKIKSKPLLRVLRTAGYTAILRVLQRALKDVRQEWSREHRRIYRPWVSAPGEVLLVDWGEVGTIATPAGDRKLLCFCAGAGVESLEVRAGSSSTGWVRAATHHSAVSLRHVARLTRFAEQRREMTDLPADDAGL